MSTSKKKEAADKSKADGVAKTDHQKRCVELAKKYGSSPNSVGRVF